MLADVPQIHTQCFSFTLVMCSAEAVYTAQFKSTAHKKMTLNKYYMEILEMWANAQRDGRPAEYRWRPLFNTAKFG